MIFKKALLGAYNFIKKIYLWIFNFMADGQKRKPYRFYVHMMAILLLLVYPYAYISIFIHIFQTGAAIIDYLYSIFMATLGPVILALMVKFMMNISRKE